LEVKKLVLKNRGENVSLVDVVSNLVSGIAEETDNLLDKMLEQ
jgi:hypothetical protein